MDMEKRHEIKNLEELLRPRFGRDVELLKYKTKPLTRPGENYGSQMLAVEIKMRHAETSAEKRLNVVAKMCPPNAFLNEVFDTSVTFKKEIAVYKTIFPLLKTFQASRGVKDALDFVPECYATRINLNAGSNEIDDDAILLLENLKLSGFEVTNRMEGFDLESARLILKDLAVFHAVPVALKLTKPDVFRSKILPHLTRNTIFDGLSENGESAIINSVVETAKLDEKCLEFIPNVKRSLHEGLENLKSSMPTCEPFGTINHNDYWVNNTMLKFVNNNPTTNKMLDFQLIDYGSTANDIIFFLFTSVQMDVLAANYDKLIKLYYTTFVETLSDLKCDIAPFSFASFQKEIDVCAKRTQFFHIIVMLKHVLGLSENAKELCDITEADLVSEKGLSRQYRERIIWTILYFAKMKWI